MLRSMNMAGLPGVTVAQVGTGHRLAGRGLRAQQHASGSTGPAAAGAGGQMEAPGSA